MIDDCPICDDATSVKVFALAQAPVHRLIPVGYRPAQADFLPLDLVRCAACGHLYNQAFDDGIADAQYRDAPLSNVPVHVSMLDALQGIADYVGEAAIAGKHVVEIGAGTGHLARIMARQAAEVVVFELSRSLTPAMLPESNIRLVDGLFEAKALSAPAELIVCRQVIEHVADPGALIAEIAAALADDGNAYLEVPCGGYVADHAAICDIHLAHAQYFTSDNFTRLLGRNGLQVVRQVTLKNGHDIGFIVRRGREATHGERNMDRANDLAIRLRQRASAARSRLSTLSGEVALYGATSAAQAYLGLFDDSYRIARIFDDNPDYLDYALYGPNQVVSIGLPETDAVRAMSVIIIASYLHQTVIARKLRTAGYDGALLSMRPEGAADASLGIEAFFG